MKKAAAPGEIAVKSVEAEDFEETSVELVFREKQPSLPAETETERTWHGRVTETDISASVESAAKSGLRQSQMAALTSAYFSVFLDTMGMSLVGPILPFYAEKFDASAIELGAIFSCFSFASMISMYCMGVASDRFGRRPSILYSLFGTAVTYIIQGLAWNYWSFLGFRVLCGAFGGSQSVAAALVTDVVPRRQQPKYLAFIGASRSIAFVIGPGMASGLSEFGLRVPFFVSGALGFFGLVYAYLKLPETHPRIVEAMAKKNDSLPNEWEKEAVAAELFETPNSSEPMATNSEEPEMDDSIPTEVKFIAVLAFVFQFCFSAIQSMMGLFFFKKFGFEALELGFTSLVFALVMTLSTLFIFPTLIKRVGVFRTVAFGMLLEVLGFGLMPASRNVWLTLAAMVILIGVGNGCLVPGKNTTAAIYTNARNRGKVMAFVSAVSKIGAVSGPLVHGELFDASKGYPFFLCALLCGCVFLSLTACMLLFPEATSRKKTKELRRVYGLDQNEPRWETFVADTPTEEDMLKLGRFLSRMLVARNYRWVTHYPKLQMMLKTVFPELGTSFEEQMQQVQFIQSQMDAFQMEWDGFSSAEEMEKGFSLDSLMASFSLVPETAYIVELPPLKLPPVAEVASNMRFATEFGSAERSPVVSPFPDIETHL